MHGWDFGGGDADPLPHVTPDATGIDVGFHGTHCAGIAAAVTDNAQGVAGAAWGCSIVPLKVTDPATGQILDSAIAEAFLYAADNGVEVLSMSFGAPDQPGVREFFQALVDDAVAAGVLCVAAAGNDGSSASSFPAANDGVLAVGATDQANARATFSNFGAWVDLAAPGSQIFSTISQNYEVDFLSQFIYIFLFGWDGVSPYMLSDGTSMACPLVAGVAALVKSQVPTLTPQALAQVLLETGDAVAYDQPIGPKLNAYAAVDMVLARTAAPQGPGAPAAPSVGLRLLGVAPNPFNPRTTVRFAVAEPGDVGAELLDLAGRRVRTLLSGPVAAGEHELAWDGRDAAGRPVASGVYVARLAGAGMALSTKLMLVR
jgi:subtilisin family serine protease